MRAPQQRPSPAAPNGMDVVREAVVAVAGAAAGGRLVDVVVVELELGVVVVARLVLVRRRDVVLVVAVRRVRVALDVGRVRVHLALGQADLAVERGVECGVCAGLRARGRAGARFDVEVQRG